MFLFGRIIFSKTFIYSNRQFSSLVESFHKFDLARKYITNVPKNVIFPKTFENYHSYIYKEEVADESKIESATVSLFYTPQSNKSLTVLESVASLAVKYPNNKFLFVNADTVPRAAYDADIQHFPVALISFGGDSNRKLVHLDNYFQWEESYEWEYTKNKSVCKLGQDFAKKLEAELESFDCNHKRKAGTYTYTKGIDTDNLNVKRVGWPSS